MDPDVIEMSSPPFLLICVRIGVSIDPEFVEMLLLDSPVKVPQRSDFSPMGGKMGGAAIGVLSWSWSERGKTYRFKVVPLTRKWARNSNGPEVGGRVNNANGGWASGPTRSTLISVM